MANEFAWFICPYDPALGPGGRVGRRPSIARYIPIVPPVPGADDDIWDEAEILGNNIIVKVFAKPSTLALIRADSDFREIVRGFAIIPPAIRPAILSRLISMGYLQEEIDATGWTTSLLLDLLSTAAHSISVNQSSLLLASSLSVMVGTAVCVTPSPHGLLQNDKVFIFGANPAELNGKKTVTVISTTSFSFPTSSPTGLATGTIRVAILKTLFTWPSGRRVAPKTVLHIASRLPG